MHRSGQQRVGVAHTCTLLRAGRTWHHALFRLPVSASRLTHQVHRSDRTVEMARIRHPGRCQRC
eukprot:1801649-Prymnesium_polylepis.1